MVPMDISMLLEMQRILGAGTTAATIGDQSANNGEAIKRCYSICGTPTQSPMPKYAALIGGTPWINSTNTIGITSSSPPCTAAAGTTPPAMPFGRQFELLTKCHQQKQQQQTPPPPLLPRPPSTVFPTTVMQQQQQTPPLPSPVTTATSTVVNGPGNLSELVHHLYNTQQMQSQLQQLQQQQMLEHIMPKVGGIIPTTQTMPAPAAVTTPMVVPIHVLQSLLTTKVVPIQLTESIAPAAPIVPKAVPIQTPPLSLSADNTTPKSESQIRETAVYIAPKAPPFSAAGNTTPKMKGEAVPIQTAAAKQTPAAAAEENAKVGTCTNTDGTASSSSSTGPCFSSSTNAFAADVPTKQNAFAAAAYGEMLMTLADKKAEKQKNSSPTFNKTVQPSAAVEVAMLQQFNPQQQQQMQFLMQNLLQLYGTRYDPTVRSAFSAVPPKVERQQQQQVQAVQATKTAAAQQQQMEQQHQKKHCENASPQRLVESSANNLPPAAMKKPPHFVPIKPNHHHHQQQQQQHTVVEEKFKQYMPSSSSSTASSATSSPAAMPPPAVTPNNDNNNNDGGGGRHQTNATTATTALAMVADEYVDVVGDGAEGRSSLMRHQRKAHIEFYRKLKGLRSRGSTLDCQQCGQTVANTDACARSHLHAHCDVAQFVCKLCQRGFTDQHLVFEHINTEHPTKKGTQCIEDRRDMVQLMQLLTDCFPRIVCKTKDAMQEHLERLLSADTQKLAAAGDAVACTAAAEPTVCSNNSSDVNSSTVGGTSSMQCCHLCKADVPSERTALHAHLNAHPAFRCKKCKFVCMSHAEQKEHQRVEHGLDDEVTANSSQLPYCVSSALEVQYDMLRACFPLQNRQQQQSHSAPPPAGEHPATADASVAVSPPAAGAKRRRKTLKPDDSASAACGGKQKRNKKCSTASSIED